MCLDLSLKMSNRIMLYSRFSKESLPEFEMDDKSPFPNVNILDDIVLKKINDKEFMYQKFFSEKVLSSHLPDGDGVLYNFPLVYNQDEKVFSMEKFDGDFYSFLQEDDVEIDEVISCYLQTIMALYVIDSHGKFHGDLNPGNILYKKIEEIDDDKNEKKGYLKYVIGENTYYVKHHNKLWVVADFEYMGDKGEELSKLNNSYDDDFFHRLFGERYKDMKNPVKGSWLYDMYVISHFSEASRMSDRVYNMIQEECCMNPVDAIYHIIKNDITDLFVKK